MEIAQTVELSERKESYVETIHSLIKEHGYARVADIAAALDVTPPSVTSMLQKLDEQKFVTYTRYRGVVLTPKGKLLAKILERRRLVLKKFLSILGVSEETAEKDACELEHKMNCETVEKLEKFVKFVQSAPQTPSFVKHFEYYERTGKRPSHIRAKKTE